MKHTECEDCKLRKGDCGYHFKMDGKTNYNIASLSACDQYGNCMFFEPKAKPQGDLISREELKQHKFLIPDIQFIGGRRNDKMIEKITLAYDKGWNAAIDAIYENAPTVEQPKGEWTFCEGVTTQGYLECSICEYADFRKEYFNYCPNCGAKMKGGRR